MTRVTFSTNVADGGLSLHVDRELDWFAVRIGDYHIALTSGVLIVKAGPASSDPEVLRVPATIATDPPPF